MTSNKLTLWGIDMSPPVRAVLLTLKALNLQFDYKPMNVLEGQHLSPEYIKISPQHTIPTLEVDNHVICDSHAIMAYLVSKYAPNDSLYPRDLLKRALVDQRLYYESSVLFTGCLRQVMAPFFRGLESKQIMLSKLPQIEQAYEVLERFLEQHNFMAGNQVTIADFSIVSTVSSLIAGVPLDEVKYAKLHAWFKRMQQLPYYEQGNGKGAKMLVAAFTAMVNA